MWPGAEIDVLTVFVEPTPDLWEADCVDNSFSVFVLLALDENEEETGEIAGIEIVGFLEFDHWDEIPDLPILWQLPGQEPLTLVQLLKRQQRQLREREGVLTRT